MVPPVGHQVQQLLCRICGGEEPGQANTNSNSIIKWHTRFWPAMQISHVFRRVRGSLFCTSLSQIESHPGGMPSLALTLPTSNLSFYPAFNPQIIQDTACSGDFFCSF